MTRISRRYAGLALLVACMAIPAMTQAQTSSADRALMNRVGPELRGQVGTQQPGATHQVGDQSLASRALLGTVEAMRLDVSESGEAAWRFPTPDEALLGRSRANIRKEH